jgi:hypothetical protein
LWLESGDAHPENHIGMRRVAAIGGFGDLREVCSIGTVMHEAIMEVVIRTRVRLPRQVAMWLDSFNIESGL